MGLLVIREGRVEVWHAAPLPGSARVSSCVPWEALPGYNSSHRSCRRRVAPRCVASCEPPERRAAWNTFHSAHICTVSHLQGDGGYTTSYITSNILVITHLQGASVTCVNSDVVLQRGRLSESLVAILAQVGSLTRMRPHVTPQTCTLCKPLTTLKQEVLFRILFRNYTKSHYLYYRIRFDKMRLAALKNSILLVLLKMTYVSPKLP